MIENARRQLAFVTLVLIIALGLCIAKNFTPTLGLDLSGGTRLIYTINVQKAIEKGQLQPPVDIDQLMQETIPIIYERIDPSGTLDPTVTRRGETDILIEIAKLPPDQVDAIERAISNLGRLEMRVLARDVNKRGADFDLAKEKERLNAWLDQDDHRAMLHEDPLKIRLFNIKSRDEGGRLNPELKWFPRKILPDPRDPKRWEFSHAKGAGETPPDEAVVAAFTEEWYQRGPTPERPFLVELFAIDMGEEYFTGEDMNPAAVRATRDDLGSNAVAYAMNEAKATAYADWSEKYIGEKSAIILNGIVRIAPVFRSRITGGRGIIEGRFTDQEVEELIRVLKTGSLRVAPERVSRVTIDATLGRESIQRGVYSIVGGGVLVLAFILLYYRLAGIVAFAAIVMNILLILAVMLFIEATLTLPGLGGLVLTMGMAVDANILIYERIREELRKGKELLQAVRLGFDRAMVTILDANITTFIAGIVLYNVGVGPVRGFAVTLMVGIATSVFTAFFVSRLIFHYLLAAKVLRRFRVAEWLVNVRANFLRWSRVAFAASSIAVIAGLAAFATIPADVKYGLDFTGGADLRVVLKEPMSAEDMRQLLASHEKFRQEFPNPQVNRSAEKPNEFTIKLKLTDRQLEEIRKLQEAHDDSKGPFEPPYKRLLREVLADKLVPAAFSNPFRTPIPGNPTTDVASITLHFARPVQRAEVLKRMQAEFGNVTVLGRTDEESDWTEEIDWSRDMRLEFDVAKGEDPNRFFDLVTRALVKRDLPPLKDKEGHEVMLSNPIPDAEEIGGRMVGELRTAAIGAIVLSLFLIVMYIRIRFHEYKYGIGAVVALVHDVLITLGVVVFWNWTGWVHAEIDLPMIAAFLTIIGYSINDTIIIFDRIRENLSEQQRLGESKESFRELVNRSINQTLSRTILTSSTTLFVVLAQFVVNYGSGSSLESFSFALIVGILSGTYSTIFMASPVVIWLRDRQMAASGDGGPKPAGKIAMSGS